MFPGGRWVPRWCVPRQRVAIIVPFRDRESHLGVFLNVLHPFLQRQLVDYAIFVVEQVILLIDRNTIEYFVNSFYSLLTTINCEGGVLQGNFQVLLYSHSASRWRSSTRR